LGRFGYLEGRLRFLLRFFSLICLAAATIAGTIDSIQSVAASTAIMTSLGNALKGVSPSAFERLQATISAGESSRTYGPAVQWLLLQPAFAVFLAISLLVWMVAYRREPRGGHSAA
jgi:hypothetical protein